MWKWTSLVLSLFSSLPVSASTVTTEDLDLYLRTTRPGVTLWMHALSEDGSYVLTPKLELSEDSILLVDTKKLIETFNNYGKNYEDSSRAAISKRAGYICEVSVVDTDEDPEDINQDNRWDESTRLGAPLSYCLEIHELRSSVVAADGNGNAVEEAYKDYLDSGDPTRFQRMSADLDQVEAEAMSIEFDGSTEDLLWDASFVSSKGIRSPIKNKEIQQLRILSGFGMRKHPLHHRMKMHRGVDIAANVGTEIVAALDGKVIKRSYQARLAGKYIVLRHKTRGMATKYFHLSKQIAKQGRSYDRGDTIALSGQSGGVTGPHLHFEIWSKKKGKLRAVNPNTFLKVTTEARLMIEKILNLFTFKSTAVSASNLEAQQI